MSTLIQVSYTDEKELQTIIKQLGGLTEHIKRKKEQSGKFKKAYITIKNMTL